MKKCPKCKAEIQEEARFCLYCMTSFEEKQTIETPKENNKRWLIVIAAVLVVALIIGSVILFMSKGTSANGGNDTSSDTAVNSEETTSENTATSSEQQGDSSKENQSSGNSDTVVNTSSNGNPSTTSSNGNSSNNGSQTNTSSNTSTSLTSSDSNNDSSDSTSSASTTTPSETTVEFLYRDAVPADDYSGSSTITSNAVVITGVKTASNDGIYDIPETIGGKKVVAIMNSAFCGDEIKSTVKKVIIPVNVKTINAQAFYKCYNLTDIYIKGEAVACPSVILPESANRNFKITIHASLTCHDRNFRTYKTLCTYWNADFEEWNG